MSIISYGDYNFPSPLPFVGIDENQVFVSGKYDYSSLSITLEGQLTGCDYISLYNQRRDLVNGLSSGFQYLTVGNTGYQYAKPISINFEDSIVSKSLPYSISLEAFHEKDFSDFFGIQNPVDVWEYQEEEGRTVSATHTVSAQGLKVSETDSLTLARNFVNSRLNDFENISLFFSGNSVIKTASSESINRVNNEYSITENYLLSESFLGYDSGSYIVRPNCNISYSDDNLSISVDGNIRGGITGQLTEEFTGLFSPSDATSFARDCVSRTKIPFEESLYGEVFREAITYNYDIDTGANNISFSFNFGDPSDIRNGEVLHDYNTEFSASKDGGTVNAKIDGSLKYNSTKDIFTGQSPELETRYKKIEETFSGISPFSILSYHHSEYFNNLDIPYSKQPLNDNFISYNINKRPHDSEITYSYSYSNKKDLTSGILRNAQLSVSTQHSIPKFSINPTIDNSFSVQETYDTLRKTSISLNGIVNSGYSFDEASSYFNSFVSQYSGQKAIITQDSVNTGNNNSISLSKSFTIINE